MSTPPSAPEEPRDDHPQNIAAAIAEVSERATQLVREEIELAKVEVAEKTGKLIRGAVVGAVAGVFVLMALIFALVGCAWLLYYYLPGNNFTYFWGFFALAAALLLLGVLAGLIAAKAVKKGAPPVPNMAIEEARKIRETMSGEDASGGHASGANASGASATAAASAEPSTEPGTAVHEAVSSYAAAGASGAEEGRG